MSESAESNYMNEQDVMGGANMGQTGMTGISRGGANQDDPLMAANPFSAPPDEDIFSFKERERMEKAIFREQNKNLKIWQKNRPTREGCLRKLCETDIEPAALAINPKVADKINVAEAAGFNVPVERAKNRDNRWDLIQKKREMFLVQMMLDTKDKEIRRLLNVNKNRQKGLILSEQMLEQDTQQFLNFFSKIKQETQDASKVLDTLRKTRNDLTIQLRVVQENTSMLKSKVGKNIE